MSNSTLFYKYTLFPSASNHYQSFLKPNNSYPIKSNLFLFRSHPPISRPITSFPHPFPSCLIISLNSSFQFFSFPLQSVPLTSHNSSSQFLFASRPFPSDPIACLLSSSPHLFLIASPPISSPPNRFLSVQAYSKSTPFLHFDAVFFQIF